MSLGNYIKNELPSWPNWFNAILLRLNCFGGLVYGQSYRKFKNHLNDADPKQLLLDSVNHAVKHVPYYRKKYGATTIHSVEEFREKIDFIDKDEVMAHWDDFVVDDIDWSKVSTGTTGGTSGKPLKLVTPNNRYAWELAYMHSMWEKTGWNYHIRGVIRNHDLKGRDYAINPIMKELIIDPHKMSEDYAKRVVDVLHRFNVRFLHAYPSNAYQFCKLCVRQGINIGFIEAILCGSEGVTEEQRAFFDKQGISVLSFYGHSEKLILGSNNAKDYIFRMESNYGLCELIDKDDNSVTEPGALGEMVGTSFYNRYFPLIRYRTGDYATLYKNGRFMELVNILGRREKSLIYRMDGTTTSLTIINLHGDFYEHIDGMQYIQEKVGFIKVLLIKNELYTQSDEEFIVNHLATSMGGREFVEISYVNKLIIQPNGKFLPLISKIVS